MNRRLRQWGRYAGQPGWCSPPSDVVTPGERGSIHYESMESSPDTSWVQFEPISQAGKPRKGRHRRQR